MRKVKTSFTQLGSLPYVLDLRTDTLLPYHRPQENKSEEQVKTRSPRAWPSEAAPSIATDRAL